MTETNEEFTAHLAGLCITLTESRQIQRCMVCGCKLFDSKDLVYIDDNGRRIVWPIFSWIEVSESGTARLLEVVRNEVELSKYTPPNSCVGLVE